MLKLTAIQYKEIIHSEERDYIEKTASGILGEYKDLVKSEEDLLHRLMDAFSYIKKLGFTDKKAISSFLCLTAFNDSFYLNPKIRSLLERPGVFLNSNTEICFMLRRIKSEGCRK